MAPAELLQGLPSAVSWQAVHLRCTPIICFSAAPDAEGNKVLLELMINLINDHKDADWAQSHFNDVCHDHIERRIFN